MTENAKHTPTPSKLVQNYQGLSEKWDWNVAAWYKRKDGTRLSRTEEISGGRELAERVADRLADEVMAASDAIDSHAALLVALEDLLSVVHDGEPPSDLDDPVVVAARAALAAARPTTT